MKKILASLFILLSITVFSAEKVAIEKVELCKHASGRIGCDACPVLEG